MDFHKLQKILQDNNLPPIKRLGQNFLYKEKILKKIVDSADIEKGENVIEIGPGVGSLTEELNKTGAKIKAIEKDERLIAYLMKTFPEIELTLDDALQFIPPKEEYKVVANIPYYITSPLINHFLLEQFSTGGTPPKLMVILTQKEVAEKICAPVNKHSLISFNVNTFGKPEIVSEVSKKYFYPVPKVESAILKITVFDKPVVSCNLKNYFRLLNFTFHQRRKTISNSLAAGLHKKSPEIAEILEKNGINPKVRPQELMPKDFEKLTNIFY